MSARVCINAARPRVRRLQVSEKTKIRESQSRPTTCQRDVFIAFVVAIRCRRYTDPHCRGRGRSFGRSFVRSFVGSFVPSYVRYVRIYIYIYTVYIRFR